MRLKNLTLSNTVHRSKDVQKRVGRCKYCGIGHPLKQCPAYDKKCGGCRKSFQGSLQVDMLTAAGPLGQEGSL